MPSLLSFRPNAGKRLPGKRKRKSIILKHTGPQDSAEGTYKVVEISHAFIHKTWHKISLYNDQPLQTNIMMAYTTIAR